MIVVLLARTCVVTIEFAACGRLGFDATTEIEPVDPAALAIGTPGGDLLGRPATDAAGNIYLAGSHGGPLVLDGVEDGFVLRIQ